jgi:hypothetical protein
MNMPSSTSWLSLGRSNEGGRVAPLGLLSPIWRSRFAAFLRPLAMGRAYLFRAGPTSRK